MLYLGSRAVSKSSLAQGRCVVSRPQSSTRHVTPVRLLSPLLSLAVLAGAVAPAAAQSPSLRPVRRAGIAPPVAASDFITFTLTPTALFTKTVGTDPGSCANTNVITITGPGYVTYCYAVTNTGLITVVLQDLIDSELGDILGGNEPTLGVGASMFLTQSAWLTQTTVNQVSLMATLPLTQTPPLTLTNAATVTVVPLGLIPSIALTKTVGTDPATCAASKAITLVGGGDVTYCYTVVNTGNLTLNLHDLDDTNLGQILQSYYYTLTPGASTFVTASAFLTQTTVNGATWVATNAVSPTIFLTISSPGLGVHALNGTLAFTTSATDYATATVLTAHPSIVLTKTVGTDPGVCAGTGTITVVNQAHADVYYCYQVLNTGDVTLSVHDLVDSELGTLLSGFSYDLPPGGSTNFIQGAALTQTTANTATWTAGLAGIASASAGGLATVDFDYVNVAVLSRSGLALLLLVVAGAGLVLLRRYV